MKRPPEPKIYTERETDCPTCSAPLSIQWHPDEEGPLTCPACRTAFTLPAKLPWPKDAVMIVANFPEKANRGHMQTANQGNCRHCGRDILYDGWTYDRAKEMYATPSGRTIEFFCVDCFRLYDFQGVTVFEDHRFPKPQKPKSE